MSNKGSSSSSSSKADRKTMEKNRRDHMKSLCSDLTALIQRGPPREATSISDQLDETANYIKKLEAKVKELKDRKNELTGGASSQDPTIPGLKLPDVEICSSGSTVHVALITAIQYRSMFKQVVGILHEEGAEVVHANFSVVDQTVFHTIQAQTENEDGAKRLGERLKKFVYDIDGIL